MNRTRAKELLPIIAAYVNGETVQWINPFGEWKDCSELSFTDDNEYRIKPKPRLRPWTPEEAPKVFVARKIGPLDGDMSVAFLHADSKRYNIFLNALCHPKALRPVSEVTLSYVFENYLRIDEHGNGHPCGVVCEEGK